jgi:hypothetical protein
MNLFLSTRRLAEHKKEDHLTEFVAACLLSDPGFANDFLARVLGNRVWECGWRNPSIRDLKTQHTCTNAQGRACRPDLVLWVKCEAGERVLACEHKIDAPEGQDPEKPESSSQLRQYLSVSEFDALAYVRADWASVAEDIVRHPKYLAPTPEAHFLWRDFYPDLLKQTGHLTRWLREGFERLGFTPPPPGLPEVSFREEHRENRETFAKFWAATRNMVWALGWRHIGAASQSDLVLRDNPGAAAERVWISPLPCNGARLRVRITCRPPVPAAAMKEHMLEALAGSGCGHDVDCEVRTALRSAGHVDVLDVEVALRRLLDDAAGATEIELRLKEYLETILTPLVTAN